MICSCCGHQMEEGKTRFIASKEGTIYVVEHVPCFTCPICEHTVYSQEVAKQLERYTSGRVWPHVKPMLTWVFIWDKPIIEIPKETVPAQTRNAPVPIDVPGSAYVPVR